MSPSVPFPPARRPLIVTGDQDLLDDLVRLAAAGGTEAEVAPDPVAARSAFRTAPMVVIGADQVVACARAGFPPRPRLILAGRGAALDRLWELAPHLGAEHVAMLPEAEPWLVDKFGSRVEAAPAGLLVATVGGRGGAGASTLAGALAVTAAGRGLRTLLLDADPLGGGLDLMLGWEGAGGLRWPSLAEAGAGFDRSALLGSLPTKGDLVLLSFDRESLPAIPLDVLAVTLATAREGRDFTVVDLPRRLDEAAVLALGYADETFLVVPSELRAIAAARQILATVRPHSEALSVVGWGSTSGKVKMRDVARSLGLPLAGEVPFDPRLGRDVEDGRPPAADGQGKLPELCERLIARVTARAGRVAA